MKKQLIIILLLAAQAVFVPNLFAQCDASATGGTLTCVAPSVQLDGASNTPNVTFAWSSASGFTSTEEDPFVTEPGDYVLTVTDPSNGCTATATATVNFDTWPPILSVSPTGAVLSCANSQITVFCVATPPAVSYLWTGPNGFGSSQQNPIVTMPGIYTVVATSSNGCTSQTSITIVQDQSTPSVTVVGGAITCNNPQVTIHANSNQPNATYSWSGPNNFLFNAQNPIVTEPGNYTVTVTNVNGCTATATAVVVEDLSALSLDIVNVPCGSVQTGSASVLNPNGLSILWSNGSTDPQIDNLPPGVYCVTVENPSGGCEGDSCIVIEEEPGPTLAFTITSLTCDNTNNGAITVTVTGGTPPYSFAWSNGQNVPTLVGLQSGTYSLTVTDAHGCTAVLGPVTLVAPSQIATSPVSITPAPDDCSSIVDFQVSGGSLPYTLEWGGGFINSLPTQLPPGSYIITITDANGCTANVAFNVPVRPGCGGTLHGHVFQDINDDCQPDAANQPLATWLVKASDGNATYYSLTDTAGYWFMGVPVGTFTVELVPPGNTWQVCGLPVQATISSLSDSAEVDFLAYSDLDCPQMLVDVSTGLLRRCFDNNFVNVFYQNFGTVAATDAYVLLDLDPLLEIQSATIPYTNLGSNQFRFDLGDVPPLSLGSFSMLVEVSCNAVLGQLHCIQAHIFPDTLCTPANQDWSGASLDLTANCQGDSLQFLIKNIGSGGMTVPLEYVVIEDGVMLRTDNAPPLPAGGSMPVKVPANGSTWRVEAEQEPNHPGHSTPALSIEGCSANGAFTTGFAGQFPPNDADPWIDIECRANQGSYDPNDKQGFPLGYGPKHYIRPGTDIEYLIRFQNTGTDTAFTVVVRDTLSAWLDPASVRPGAASHPYKFDLSGQGLLTFRFDDILLPDSNVNEPASHGYVKFRVAQRADVPLETDIRNSAAIYFDFNDPVITNTTVHRVGENFLIAAWQPARPDFALRLAPNPMADAAWLETQGLPNGESLHLRLFDLRGNLVRTENALAPRFLLRRNDLPPGLYFLKIETANGLFGAGKIVLR